MAWYTKFFKGEEKLNPAQPYYDEKEASSKEPTFSYQRAYESIEVVNRGVNMIVDDVSVIPTTVEAPHSGVYGVVKGIKRATVNKLINYEPNPFQDISTFRRNLVIDYILDGNIFIYFDGVHLYHLPADKMQIHASETTYIDHFSFNNSVDYKPSEIIHIKENSFYSIYRGTSRLRPALATMQLLMSMKSFQDNFFKNGAVPGLVIKSPNTLSEKIKQRMIDSWTNRYRPGAGGRRPLILDGGLEVAPLATVNFQQLDFQQSIADNEKIVLKALGVPPIMLDSGNNANLAPNMKMYYLETIIPIVKKINCGYERFFGFKMTEEVDNVMALQPEMSDEANYYSSLVNNGIISVNEAREPLGWGPAEGQDEIRVPQNIAGSASNPSQGGRPKEPEEDEPKGEQ